MQRIADDFAAINARLSEISAEKAKARGDEPKPEDAQSFAIGGTITIPVGSTPTWAYQAPDDYCGFKREIAISSCITTSQALEKSTAQLFQVLWDKYGPEGELDLSNLSDEYCG